ncbi:MAG: uracil-DNA glycosylase [Deltaproteobacteria bacterium]|nr:uracil-DNA glycosylase [Deltaproteobacteria bacterium]
MEIGASIDCHKCRFYYVTWDKRFPHGCRGMGFKSRQLPNLVVRGSSSGRDCLMYQEKRKVQVVSNRGAYA